MKPLVWDVTSGVDFAPGAENELTYFGWSYDGDDPKKHNEDGCGGVINMVSYLLFYDE